MTKTDKALNHIRDMAAMLLLMAIMLFAFSLTLTVKSTAGFFSIIGLFIGAVGFTGACVHLYFAKQAIDRS